jgi:hypothetical protein
MDPEYVKLEDIFLPPSINAKESLQDNRAKLAFDKPSM